MKLSVAAAFLALNFYVYHHLASEEVQPARLSFAAFPDHLGHWTCPAQQRVDPKVLENLGVTDYLLCDFRRESPRAVANVYVGYHASQVRKEGGGPKGTSIHPPKHCLPGSGWDIIQAERVPLDLPLLPQPSAPVNRLVIAKGEARQLVYYWYQSRGRVVADDWKKILLLFWDRARLQRSDGSLVRITVPLQRGEMAEAEGAFRDLAALVVEKLPAYIPERSPES